ncbi:adenosylmethionine decarboxylase [Candidatus Falkowbacteria bacterium]|nr:adenosylmethionine decarboxylase [Candidatus Falkowbacteria bacterium]
MEKKNKKQGPKTLGALGRHLLVELRDCAPGILNNLEKVKNILVRAAKKSGATIIVVSFYELNPFGIISINGMVIIAESHLSIRTWPEYDYAAVDIFTCGDLIKPEVAAQYLIERFESKNPSLIEIKRGYFPDADILVHKPEGAGPPPQTDMAKVLS